MDKNKGIKPPSRISKFVGLVFNWLHWIYISQAATSFLYLGVIAAWVWLDEHSRQASLVDFLAGAPFARAVSAFFFIAFSATVVLLLLLIRSTKQIAINDRKKSSAVEQSFMEAAYINATCDMMLFSLFHGMLGRLPVGSTAAIVGELKAAQGAVWRNIQDQANLFRQILVSFTGKPCPVSIKRVERDEIDPASSEVSVIARDSASASQRGRIDDQAFKVKDNTAFIEVYLEGKPRFVCDDLMSLALEGRYVNNREGWQKDYNATIVASIPKIGAACNPDSQTTAGFLCADNDSGGFETNPDCKRYISEIAWRLAVMLYRYDQLDQLIDEISSNSRKKRGGR